MDPWTGQLPIKLKYHHSSVKARAAKSKQQQQRQQQQQQQQQQAAINGTPAQSENGLYERMKIEPTTREDRVRVYLDIEIDGRPALHGSNRVVLELYSDIVPKTAENFRALITGELLIIVSCQWDWQ